MKHSKFLILMTLIPFLCACNNTSVDSVNSETSASESVSVTPIVSDAISDLAEEIAYSASKYDSTVTRDSILVEAIGYDSSISTEITTKVQHLFLFSYCAFSDLMPEKIGARAFEGYNNDPGASFANFDEKSPYFTAFKFFSDAGLIDATKYGSEFDATVEATEQDIHTLLDRLHAYYGTSAVDDFYNYANYEQRYGSYTGPSLTPDDDANVLNLVSTTNLINWTKEQTQKYDDAKLAHDAITGIGETNLLKGFITPFYEANTAAELLELMLSYHQQYGYAPYYDVATLGDMGVFNGLFLDPINLKGTSSENGEGSDLYNQTISTYEPLFASLLENETLGAEMAANLAYFYHIYSIATENSTYPTMGIIPVATLPIGDLNYNFQSILLDIGFTADDCQYIYTATNELPALYSLFIDENLDALKGYITYQMMYHYKAILPDTALFNNYFLGENVESKFDDLNFYNDTFLPYIEGNIVDGYTKSQEYADKIEDLTNLFDDIKTAMKTKINASYLSNDGKEKSLEKLEKMKSCFGIDLYDGSKIPVNKVDYTTITNGNALSYVCANDAMKWSGYNERVGLILEDSFVNLIKNIYPLTLNAFYRRQNNGMIVTIGMIGANSEIDTSVKEDVMSSFGWVLGHELGHGYDKLGFGYDSDGNLNSEWISQEDMDKFNEFADKYAAYMDGEEIMPDITMSGTIILDEAIADNIGISLCLEVGKGIENFSLKDFFIEGARTFGGYMTRATCEGLAISDTHPLGKVRINKAFAAFDEFHETFNTKEGDYMYLNDDERLVLY